MYSVVKDYIFLIVSSLVQVHCFHIGASHSHYDFHPTSGCEVLSAHIGQLHQSVSCTGFQRYNFEPSQAPDLQYCEHQPYLPPNGTLHITAKRHVPDSNTYQLMLDPILPAPSMDDGLREVDSMVPMNTPTPSQENEFVQTMDKYISNSYSLYDSNTYILLYVFNVI